MTNHRLAANPVGSLSFESIATLDRASSQSKKSPYILLFKGGLKGICIFQFGNFLVGQYLVQEREQGPALPSRDALHPCSMAVGEGGRLAVGAAGTRSVTRVTHRLARYCGPDLGKGCWKVDASAGLMPLVRALRAGGFVSSGEFPIIPA